MNNRPIKSVHLQRDINLKVYEIAEELEIPVNRVINFLIEIGYLSYLIAFDRKSYDENVLLDLVRMKKDEVHNNYRN